MPVKEFTAKLLCQGAPVKKVLYPDIFALKFYHVLLAVGRIYARYEVPGVMFDIYVRMTTLYQTQRTKANWVEVQRGMDYGWICQILSPKKNN